MATGTKEKIGSDVRKAEDSLTDWLDIPATICVVGAAASLFWVGWPPEVPRTLQYEGKAYKASCDYAKKTVKLQVRDLRTNEVQEREYTREQVSTWRVRP